MPTRQPFLETQEDDAPSLDGQLFAVAALSAAQRSRMYSLLARYFQHTTPARFEADLAEKEWAILLTHPESDQIHGFSTLMCLPAVLDGQPVVALFSGDTIIQPEYWGSTALPRLWASHVFDLADSLPQTRVFWFLICSGYKTYRFLPVFFRQFYPTYQQAMPAPIKNLLNCLGQQKFPTEYDPAAGVIRPVHSAPLRPGVAEITPQRLQDPHIAFFAQANPGYANGHELACLAEINRANLTSAGQRILRLLRQSSPP
jgi:hypothetical protein